MKIDKYFLMVKIGVFMNENARCLRSTLSSYLPIENKAMAHRLAVEKTERKRK